ncbi:MAG: hypothetical protein ACRENP_18910 [Longimicrobiales bacterium]
MTEPTRPDGEPNTTVTRAPYERPQLTRWGKLTDLTYGGGGRRAEPSKRQTRF